MCRESERGIGDKRGREREGGRERRGERGEEKRKEGEELDWLDSDDAKTDRSNLIFVGRVRGE